MGIMVDGEWRTEESFPTSGGHFVRAATSFRNWITPDGAPGPSGSGGFRAAAGTIRRGPFYFTANCRFCRSDRGRRSGPATGRVHRPR
jgi:glutathionyl-hydroquinone reductase